MFVRPIMTQETLTNLSQILIGGTRENHGYVQIVTELQIVTPVVFPHLDDCIAKLNFRFKIRVNQRLQF